MGQRSRSIPKGVDTPLPLPASPAPIHRFRVLAVRRRTVPLDGFAQRPDRCRLLMARLVTPIGNARAARSTIPAEPPHNVVTGSRSQKHGHFLQCQPWGGSVRRPVPAKTLTLFD